MTVLSGKTLRRLAAEGKPIVTPFYSEKMLENGMSFGCSVAGYDIRIAETVVMPGFLRRLFGGKRFQLASTVERFDMPTNVIGLVCDKSTMARKGLSDFNTVIEPGWRGWLTLELVYFGWRSKRIPSGSPIAQVLFLFTDEDTEGYGDGKYQDQRAGAQPAIEQHNPPRPTRIRV